MIKKSLTAVVATMVFATGIHGAELKGGNAWQLANGDLVFGGRTGGLSARFLAFEEWDADNNSISDRDWAIDSLIEHDGEVWWAETDPALADEPGVAAAWVQFSGATSAGGGATITAGTANPIGGSDGDAYLQVDTSVPAEVQAIWRNVSSTWTPYALPAGADGDDGATGADGADGAVGPTGPAGADGAGTSLSTATPHDSDRKWWNPRRDWRRFGCRSPASLE